MSDQGLVDIGLDGDRAPEIVVPDVAQALLAADPGEVGQRDAATVAQRHAEMQDFGDVLELASVGLDPHLEFLAIIAHIGDHQPVDQQQQRASDLAGIQPGAGHGIGVKRQHQFGAALVGIVFDVLQALDVAHDLLETIGCGADLVVGVTAHLDADRFCGRRATGQAQEGGLHGARNGEHLAADTLDHLLDRAQLGRLWVQTDHHLAEVVAESLLGLVEHAAGVTEDGAHLAFAHAGAHHVLDLLRLGQGDRQWCFRWHSTLM